MERGAIDMTQSDLVLRLIEMLLAEKDKNINQSNAEEKQKNED